MQFSIVRPWKDDVLKAPVDQYETVFHLGSGTVRDRVGAHDHAGITDRTGYRVFANVKREEVAAFVLEHEGGLAGEIGYADHASVTIDPVQLGILGTWVV